VRPDRIAVGDCYDDPPTAEVERFEVVSCDQAHDNEVFHVFEATGAEYPGEEQLLDDAAVRCRGDREVVCVLYADGGGRIVGSARSDR
jgi:hypothetical protein